MAFTTTAFLDHLRQSIATGAAIAPPAQLPAIRNVIIAAPDGDAAGAQLAQMLIASEIRVPIVVLKDDNLPAFADAHSLCILFSLAGHTDASQPLMMQAHARGTALVCLAPASALQAAAQQHGIDHVALDGYAPGLSVAGGVAQLLFVLHRYGLIGAGFVPQLDAAAGLIDRREYFLQDGAENLAWALAGKLPVLYGESKFEPVLRHFQAQLQTVSKQMAHVNVFPELIFNELDGWQHPEAVRLQTMIVLLTTDFDAPQVAAQIDAARSWLMPRSGGIAEVSLTHGASLLEQALYALHLFDWTAFYLAGKNGEDPHARAALAALRAGLTGPDA